jgi:hypothetical protein
VADEITILANQSWSFVNPYLLLGATSQPAWPRGFPLELMKISSISTTTRKSVNLMRSELGVVQYLANHDPDVDAIYRLLLPLPLDFPLRGFSPLVMKQHQYAPYNAQATLHLYKSFWALLLPVTVHGRVSDIWRSFAAQRMMQDVQLRLAFHPPIVVQHRNSHNYLADFDAELPLYTKSLRLVQQLTSWKSCSPTLPGRLEDLWIMLFEHDYLDESDVFLLQSWLQSLLMADYKFPPVNVVTNCVANSPQRM